ncbi:acetyltransferase [Salinarchaeum sp. Harcht-Bsk1]|uniref:GNAT family N-acetyltransferase n=1 Tax=Salinarchaeum sp. Harcht-Bsk1 TaxID=1333523 RepID=UPI0003424353|nr:GNAT family N-acetyltransferase [Salinarchaeum sp. Harcht-Bsk1]AGN02346.1 acetyltransferase [Salinarchaeum sp. Harcht-Bsk1]
MSVGGARSPVVRVATTADHVAVSRVLDGALLEVDGLRTRLEDGTVLVATLEGTSDAVVGTLVVAPEGPTNLDPPADWPDAAHLRAIAVRRKRRRSGIGTALLDAARERWSPLVADFDADVEPFYEALGAECQETPDGRRWALLRAR